MINCNIGRENSVFICSTGQLARKIVKRKTAVVRMDEEGKGME